MRPPDLILVAGRVAETGLFGTKGKETGMLMEIPCVVTCHPAAAMRFPDMNRVFRKGLDIFRKKAEAVKEKNR